MDRIKCHECSRLVKYYVRVSLAPFDFRPICLDCAKHLDWLYNGLIIKGAAEPHCEQCGASQAAEGTVCLCCSDLNADRDARAELARERRGF